MALKEEIQSGPLAAPLAPLVARGADNEIAAALNLPRYTVARPIPRIALLKWAVKHGLLAKLRDAMPSAAGNATQRSAAEAALILITGTFTDDVDITDASIAALFTALETAGIVSPAAAADRPAVSKLISRAEQAFGANVSDVDVARALRG